MEFDDIWFIEIRHVKVLISAAYATIPSCLGIFLASKIPGISLFPTLIVVGSVLTIGGGFTMKLRFLVVGGRRVQDGTWWGGLAYACYGILFVLIGLAALHPFFEICIYLVTFCVIATMIVYISWRLGFFNKVVWKLAWG